MPLTGTVNAVTYQKIVTAGAENWAVDLTDQNGNVVSEIVIEADTTLGALTLELPAISTLNNFWNTKITVVALTGGTNDVIILPYNSAVPPLIETNTIGALSNLKLQQDNQVAEVNVGSTYVWYGVATV